VAQRGLTAGGSAQALVESARGLFEDAKKVMEQRYAAAQEAAQVAKDKGTKSAKAAAATANEQYESVQEALSKATSDLGRFCGATLVPLELELGLHLGLSLMGLRWWCAAWKSGSGELIKEGIKEVTDEGGKKPEKVEL